MSGVSADASVNSMPRASRLLSISLNKYTDHQETLQCRAGAYRESFAENVTRLEEFAPAKQEIVCMLFRRAGLNYEEMRRALLQLHAARAAEKLRGEHQAYCRFISAFVKTSPCPERAYYGNSAAVTLLTHAGFTRHYQCIVKCTDKIWRDGHRYQKAGVMRVTSSVRA